VSVLAAVDHDEAAFCVETTQDAPLHYGKPNISATRGFVATRTTSSQFTDAAFTGVLADNSIAMSMDGKGSWPDKLQQ
jgi:putative transposase